MNHNFVISDSTMEVLFRLAIAAKVASVPLVAYFAWRWIQYWNRREAIKNPDLRIIPQPIYRIVELREFLDPLFIKLYGRVVDDFLLLRIDRALGQATVKDYRRIVAQAVPNRGFSANSMFLSLARDAAVIAELSRKPIDMFPMDAVELQAVAKQRQEPADVVKSRS